MGWREDVEAFDRAVEEFLEALLSPIRRVLDWIIARLG